MKIVIAPDSFKESLSAKQVCVAVEQGFKAIYPEADYLHLPLADGGEGTVEVLMAQLGGQWQTSCVEGPNGELVSAQWALLDKGKTALIEIAAASGLDLLPTSERNPMLTSTYGTGQIIQQALSLGVDKIVLGLGGSATNDGGAGIIEALGGRLLDAQGQTLPRGGAALSNLAEIDVTGLDPRCQHVELIVACDVDNPLYGQHGASVVFGPQKGATAEMVDALDMALADFASVAQLHTSFDPHTTKGFGAAGGTPLGLSVAFNLQMVAGIDMVLSMLNAKDVIAGSDLLITGEGQMDHQTVQGKTPWGIASLAAELDIPVIAIAGSNGRDLTPLYSKMNAVFDSVRSPQALPQVLAEAEANVIRTARNIAATLRLGQQLS